MLPVQFPMRNFSLVRRRDIKKFFLHFCTTEKHQLSLYVSVLIKVPTSMHIFSTSTQVPKLCSTSLISQCFFPVLLIRDFSYLLRICAYIMFFSIPLFTSEKTAENTLFRFFAFWSRFSIFWPVFNHRFGPSKRRGWVCTVPCTTLYLLLGWIHVCFSVRALPDDCCFHLSFVAAAISHPPPVPSAYPPAVASAANV